MSPEYPAAVGAGGIATNSEALIRGLTGLGHEVEVVLPGCASAHRGHTSGDGTVPVASLPHLWLPHPMADRWLDDARTTAAVRRIRPDVVHAPEWLATAVGPARWGGAPVVTRLATPTYLIEELNGAPAGSGTALLRRLEREQAQRSRIVYGPTHAVADRVGKDWDLPDVRIVPNPMDVSLARRSAQRAPIMELPARFIAFSGRLERRKGLETLGQALPAVLAKHPDLQVVLVGRETPEDDRAAMRAFWGAMGSFGSRVRQLGELPREDGLAVLSGAELVVIPSLWESFGYVAIEAMALGLPVVASGAGGLAEIISHDEDGWLVPPGDPGALQAELLKRLGQPDRLAEVGRAAARRADDFDVSVVIDHVVALLEEAVDGGAGPLPDKAIYRSGYRRYFRPGSATDPFAAIYEEKRQSVLKTASRWSPRRVLDAGGGYGRIAEPLSAHHDVVLCDISEEMLGEARRRTGERTALLQADAVRLPIPAGAFGGVVSADLLCHLPDLEAGLAELARVVEPGGWLLFDTTNARPLWVLAYPAYVNWRPKRLARTLRHRGVLPEWRANVCHHRPREVRVVLRALGLELHRVEGIGPGPLTKWHLWLVRRP